MSDDPASGNGGNPADTNEVMLPDYGWAYFDQLCAEYRTLSPEKIKEIPAETQALIDKIPKQKPAPPSPLWATVGAIAAILWLVAGIASFVRNPGTPVYWIASGILIFLIWLIVYAVLPMWQKPARCPTWGDLYLMELWIIRLLPIEALRAKAWNLRDRYHNIAGEQKYQAYLRDQAHIEPNTPTPAGATPAGATPAGTPDPAGTPPTGAAAPVVLVPPVSNAEKVLRAELENLVRELHWHYSLVTKLERKRTQLSMLAGICIAVLMLGLSVPMFWIPSLDTGDSGSSGVRGTPTPQSSPRPQTTVSSTPPRPQATPAPRRTLSPPSTPAVRSTPTAISALPTLYEPQGDTLMPPPKFMHIQAGGVRPSPTVTSTPVVAPTPTPKNPAAGGGSNSKTGEASTSGGQIATLSWAHPRMKEARLLLGLVIVMGAIGGFASMQRRLQGTGNADPLGTLIGLERGGMVVVLLSPLSGAMFAIVLYLIFTGHFITGELFPEIVTSDGKAQVVSVLSFIRDTHVASGIDMAKLLIWSFIAGFAEQFVPDVLNRLVTPNKQQ